MRILAVGMLGLVLLGVTSGGCGSSNSSTAVRKSPTNGYGDAATDGSDSSFFVPPGNTAGGSCNPAFCPAGGTGKPCCVAANGPCGVDFGNGCISAVPSRDGGP